MILRCLWRSYCGYGWLLGATTIDHRRSSLCIDRWLMLILRLEDIRWLLAFDGQT